MKFTLHSYAEIDLREAAEFYKQRAGNSFSRAFLEEFEHTVTLLLQHPKLGTPWRHDTRMFALKRFPYSLIYKELDEQLIIVAVAHQSRRPGYWASRK
ncbi:type II toxin-antitoxin system RelE/ParE family toxin [Undibacterium flavidum]|uniref:Type II toxin-antitoxin system RelE/ParE family toxin n=1 Tax=Undibacterium flavidum TaxID=2762297 RepID=A0ABR6YBN6_9BURK|nr:type II toxin-antitoxin system RelE/ParE family toxin [Undibacterium flavidum]MBC3873977.1 type II toxin-antitoxin system RelE/ParE family toxin [Undibacterium flavidum]